MTSILKDSDIIEFDEVEVEDLTINGNATLIGHLNNSSTLEFKAPTVIINGGTGDTKLQIKADTDNSGETDNPSIEFFQDGDLVNSTIGIGVLSGQTNGNALTLTNTVTSGSGQDLTGGIMFKTGTTNDTATSTERLLIHPDGTTKVLFNLDVAGNILMGDDDFIQFGASNDMSIGHDPNINYIKHAKQVQFLSSMSSGDTLKFREITRRNITFTLASANASGVERSNCYISTGNETYDGVDNVPYFKFRIRSQDNTSSIANPIEIYQPGQATSTSKILLNTNTYLPDGSSLYLGDSNDFRLTHNGTDSFVQDTGAGNLHIRTNGVHIGISDTTSSTNFMAKFVKDGAVELYHNKVKKFETTSTGITITGDTQTTNTLVASGTGFSTAGIITPRLSITNGLTKASFLVDLGEGVFSAASGTVIGENNSNPHFITRLTEATYGLIYRVFMVCLEPLSGGETDIDVAVSTSSLTRGQNTGIGVLINGGTQQTETTYLQYETGSGQALEDRYLYLTTGTGTNTNAYTAGKLLIVVEGYKL